MSQSPDEDLERGNKSDGDQTQSAPNRSSQPSQGESSFGDSSGPLFSMYSKASKEADNKMVERWQKDADGILIFTGLFSAAVAALLGVTIQDLRPNSQDTSAFYLGNIYEVLADPNATRASIPSPAIKPPPFSPPRYAVWVNSLWFLSLVMGLSCALLATSLHQWARRYIRLTQPARCSPEKRARKRAFFANGVDKMHIPWAVEGLPTLLHLSLFLFFAGLAIFLFNIDHEVFISVVCWIGFFLMLYGLITLLPLIRHDSPYCTPLSKPAWFLYACIRYVTFTFLTFITSSYGSYHTWERCSDLRDRYRGWMIKGADKIAEETASERSSAIDIGILGWTIGALGDDNSLETFFEAIPGFFNSRLVKNLERDFPETLLMTFWDALDGFMGHTLSSNSVTESVKSHRVIICRDIMSMIPCSNDYVNDSLRSYFDQPPVSIERLQAMTRWFTHISGNLSYTARIRAAESLAKIPERDDRWISLAVSVCGQPERDLRDNIAHGGDIVSLAILIQVIRKTFRSDPLWDVLTRFSKLDICNSLPRLQHDFCTLWNEIVQEAKDHGPNSTPVRILRRIRHLYIALHRDTDAAPSAFLPSTDFFDRILLQPSSYPSCDIPSHRPDSTAQLHVTDSRDALPPTQLGDSPDAFPYLPAQGGNIVSLQAEQVNIFVGPPSPSNPTIRATITSETGGTSHVPTTTPLISSLYSNPHPTGASPTSGGVATMVLQDTPSAAMLSHPLEETTQRNIVAPYAEPETSGNSSTALTSTPAPASNPAVLSHSYDADAASISYPLLPVLSSVGFSISTPPSALAQPLPNAELHALHSTTPLYPTINPTMPRLRARGLVNPGSMSFVNTILQLLVHSPPFLNLFRELGDLRVYLGQHGAESPETGSSATPLVDATERFVEEFVFKENEPPSLQQGPQQVARLKPREDEKEKKERNVVDSIKPTDMYDVMKENRQLKHLLDGKHQDAEEFLRLFLNALDEELVAIQTYISTHKPVSAPSVEGLKEEAQAGGVVKRDYTASLAESPVSRLFGGRSRSTVRAPSQPDIVTVENWRSLQLDIQPDSVNTIQDSLVHISQPQPLQVGQSSSIEASQQVRIEALPPVLVLHLKRFLYDMTTDGLVKISKPVYVAPELEIPLDIMAPVAGESEKPVHYKLYGVLYHHGESSGSGKYTIDVLHQNEDGIGSEEAWLRFDDEVVIAVQHDDVFRSQDNDERGDNGCAYVLLYCRTASART